MENEERANCHQGKTPGVSKKSEDPKTTTRERKPPKKEKEDPCKLTQLTLNYNRQGLLLKRFVGPRNIRYRSLLFTRCRISVLDKVFVLQKKQGRTTKRRPLIKTLCKALKYMKQVGSNFCTKRRRRGPFFTVNNNLNLVEDKENAGSQFLQKV